VTIHIISDWDVSRLRNDASKGQKQTRKEKLMNEHAQKLQTILVKESLTPKEIQEGVVTCFFAVNRDFVKRRMGEVPAAQVDEVLDELVTQVLDEHHIDPEKPDLGLLRQAELALEEQTGFETEPDLLNMHKGIVQTLFSRAQK
jgi:dsDNA-binding SOS-regulon protein